MYASVATTNDRRSEGRECNLKGSKWKLSEQVKTEEQLSSNCKFLNHEQVVQFELSVSLLILAVLLTQKGRGNIEQSTGKWRWISTIRLVLVDLSFHQTNFYLCQPPVLEIHFFIQIYSYSSLFMSHLVQIISCHGIAGSSDYQRVATRTVVGRVNP